LCILFRTQRHDEAAEVEKAFPEAVTQAVVLLGAADLIGMIREGATALIGVIPIGVAVIIDRIDAVTVEITVEIIGTMFEMTVGILGTMFEMTVGGTELEEWSSVPHFLLPLIML
jgi:hypothetical protein